MKNYLALSIVAAAISLTACTTSLPQGNAPAGRADASIPVALTVSDNEKQAFSWGATGSQIYECKADPSGKLAWIFKGPEADLFNAKNEKVGTHGAGPFWMAVDGSKTVGTVKARADAPNKSDIPWLLLATQSVGTPGAMARVTSVQRINTRGGVAPATGCANATDVGQVSKQSYVSDYVFFVAK